MNSKVSRFGGVVRRHLHLRRVHGGSSVGSGPAHRGPVVISGIGDGWRRPGGDHRREQRAEREGQGQRCLGYVYC